MNFNNIPYKLTKKYFFILPLSAIISLLIISQSYASPNNRFKSNVLTSNNDTVKKEILFFLKRQRIKSINDYSNWLTDNIKYLKDRKKDVWASPVETLRRRYGDCEDFAFLNTATLDAMGYQTKTLLLIKKTFAHAICIFNNNGLMAFFDNDKLVRTNFVSEKQLITYLKKEYRYVFVQVFDIANKPWTQRSIDGILVSGATF